MACGRGAHHGADLHALGKVARVVELAHLAGRQADLVAVARVAGRRGAHELALRELAGYGLGDRHRGVGRAGDAHGLVHVGASRERVADGTADAGRRAAEGLDFRRVVVRLVLEEEKPVLVLPVHVHRDLDRAGVDLLGLVQVAQLSGVSQVFGADGAHVHERDGTLVATQLMPQLQVTVEGRLHGGVIDAQLGELRAEGRVAAVVRPVGVDHLDLGDRGRAPLLREVLLAVADVSQVHGQATLVDEGLQALCVELQEALEPLDRLGLRVGLHAALARAEGCFARLHGIDHVALDGREVLVAERALQHVDLGREHRGPLARRQQLHALARRVGALVELPGQVLHREHARVADVWQLVADRVRLRLRKNGGHRAREQVGIDALHVVTIEQAQVADSGDSQRVAQFMRQLLRFYVKAGFLLNIHALDHGPSSGVVITCRSHSTGWSGRSWGTTSTRNKTEGRGAAGWWTRRGGWDTRAPAAPQSLPMFRYPLGW